MKQLLLTITSLLAFTNIFSQVKSAKNELDPSKYHLSTIQLDAIYKNVKKYPNHTKIALALVKEGKVTYVGVKRENDTIVFYENSRSVFEIGSISKVFTATLLADFVENKKVELEDVVNKHLKDSIKDDITINLKQLANHSSGLPRLPSNFNLFTADPKNPYRSYNKAMLKAYLAEHLKLNNEVGSTYEYSNLGAGLLGYVLEELSNDSYEGLLQKKIFSKYQMTNSTTLRSNVKEELVKGLNASGDETSNWDFNVLVGAGGILSTVEDLSKFAQAQFDDANTGLALTRKETFKVNNNMSTGLGWHLIKTRSGSDLVWHNGGTGGYTSSMAIDVSENNAVIILSNVSAYNPSKGNIDKLCFSLLTSLKIE